MIGILPVDFFAGGKIYVPLSKLISLGRLTLKGNFRVFFKSNSIVFNTFDLEQVALVRAAMVSLKFTY